MNDGSAVSSQKTGPNNTDHESAYLAWHDRKQAENSKIKESARLVRAGQSLPLVVVVDDETMIAVTLTEILRRKGFNAVWFDEPKKALAYIRSGPVDLLLSDITMPDLDGVELVIRVRDVAPTCRFFIFSALSNCQLTMERVARLGPNVHVEAKPLRIERLVSTMAMLLERSESTTSAGLLAAPSTV